MGGGRKAWGADEGAGGGGAEAEAADWPPDDEWGLAHASLDREPLTMQESSRLEAACRGGGVGVRRKVAGWMFGETLAFSAMSRAANVTNAHLEARTIRTLRERVNRK